MTNAEIARSAYEALNGRDFERFVALTDPNVEFTSLVAEIEGDVFRGHPGVRDWWDKVTEALGGLVFDLVEVRELPDDVLVVHNRVHGEVGGVTVEQQMWQTVRTRDGLAYWWGTFRTEAEALAAI
jgi:ketosteroid isomerase-like protein